MFEKSSKSRGAFGTQAIIYDRTFSWIYLRSQSTFCSPLLSVFKGLYLKNLQWNRFEFFASWKWDKYTLNKINFIGFFYLFIYFFEFGEYCGKVFPEPGVSHTFWAPALTKNVFSIFFLYWLLLNDSRNKRVFLLCFTGFEAINFCIFFIKMSCSGSNLFF